MLKKALLPALAALLFASTSPVWAAGELTYVVNNESAKYDPGTTAETFATPIIGNAFEGLVKYAPDGSIVPALAESWTISDDGLTYSFTLRADAKWSDGKPVTAGQKVALPAGNSTVQVSYLSRTFHLDRAALDRFPFMAADGKIGFVGVASPPQRRDYRRVLAHLERFCSFYARAKLGAKEDQTLPVFASEGEAAGRPRVVVSIGPGATPSGLSLSADGQALQIRAANEAEAIIITRRLLRALDVRYPYAVPFQGGMSGLYQNVQTKHQMLGKTLNQMLQEEGLQ